MMINYVDMTTIQDMHKSLITKYGGEKGILDLKKLEDSILQPKSVVFNEEVYKTIPEKAAAYLYFINVWHPFVDGNKRVAYSTTKIFLLMNGFDLQVNQNEAYQFSKNIASGKKNHELTTEWLNKYISDHY